jgi:hypothetical protein
MNGFDPLRNETWAGLYPRVALTVVDTMNCATESFAFYAILIPELPQQIVKGEWRTFCWCKAIRESDGELFDSCKRFSASPWSGCTTGHRIQADW